MRSFLPDVAYCLRLVRRDPGFTLAAAGTLALCIGANTAVFSFADSIALRPLTVPHADQLVAVDTGASKSSPLGDTSYPDYLDFQERSTSFAGMAAFRYVNAALTEAQGGADARPQVVWGQMVSGNFFSVLGVKPALGRDFRPEEGRVEGAYPVAIISHALWVRRFGAAPGISGRQIRLNGHPFTVIGVMPDGFLGTHLFLHPDLYIPLAMTHAVLPAAGDWLQQRSARALRILARLNGGVTVARAQAEMSSVMRNLARTYPDSNRDTVATVMPEVARRAQGPNTPIAMSLIALVGLVLLIGCVNVANLVLVRATARSREVAIRLALGASRLRLFRQFFTESVFLAIAGAAGGLALGWAAIRAFGSIQLPTDMPLSLTTRMDGRVLAYTLLATLVTVLAFGIAPAWRAPRVSLAPVLRGGSEGAVQGVLRWWSARNLLVACQVLVAVVLTIAAGLFLKSFWRAQALDLGFNPNHVLLLTVDPAFRGYTKEQTLQLYDRLERDLESLPGVRSVALGQHVPLLSRASWDITVDGYSPRGGEQMLDVSVNVVGPRYFETMQIPLRGREFLPQDSEPAAGVAIVNETMARRYWTALVPGGGRIRLRNGPVLTVVGIARDGKYASLAEQPEPHFYVPHRQHYRSQMTIHLRTESDPAAAAQDVRAQVRALDPELPVFDVRTMMQAYTGSALLGVKLTMLLTLLFGVLGLVLTLVGLYGVVSYAAGRRTREIGIRMALGAARGDVLLLMLRQAMVATAAGAALGIGASFPATRAVAGVLVGVSATDVAVFVAVPMVVCAVAACATIVPAWKASRTDPIIAVRYE